MCFVYNEIDVRKFRARRETYSEFPTMNSEMSAYRAVESRDVLAFALQITQI